MDPLPIHFYYPRSFLPREMYLVGGLIGSGLSMRNLNLDINIILKPYWALVCVVEVAKSPPELSKDEASVT